MMHPKGRKHCRSLPTDVLSHLPDNVIDVILMCLPCKDAVRTSILSKKWRYNWCRLTELTLDGSLWKTKKDLLYPTIKFTKIVYQLLTLHEGPITKFTLNIANLKSCPKIDNFIYFLSMNDIQHLVLCFPLDENELYNLPSSLFKCLQLRHLTLHNCLIHPPSVFQGFDRLISMEICFVTITSELLGSLISHCPLLEHLVLEIYESSDIIEITAPMLRSFDITGDICNICLKNVPLLAKVSLIGNGHLEAEKLDFAKVFESCSALEHLVLDIVCAEFNDSEEDEAPTKLPFDLISVKRFYQPDIPVWQSFKLSCALCLIRSFPHLEYLEIMVCNDDDSDAVKFLELEHFSDVTFKHLREVKLQSFGGTTPEMQLLKLLLAKSPVLVIMLIDRYNLDLKPLDTRLKIFSEVSNFLRASPKAEIAYKNLIRS